MNFLASWLEDRISNVIVSGALSPDSVLANNVFQGTVLGPPLWNLFYADGCRATIKYFFTKTVFADDYNCWKAFPSRIGRSEILRQCGACQARLHEWGAANNMKFDPSKESFYVSHRTNGVGRISNCWDLFSMLSFVCAAASQPLRAKQVGGSHRCSGHVVFSRRSKP